MKTHRYPFWIALVAFAVSPNWVARGLAQQEPSAAEQLLIYELNRARNNPLRFDQENNLAADLTTVTSQPPLAVNNNLVASARFHANEMAVNNYFAHQSAVTGDWPNKMARDNGYVLPSFYPVATNNIESIAAGTLIDTPLEALNLLIEDAGLFPPGHRIQLLAIDPFFQSHREIGAGFAINNAATFTNYWAIHTAVRDTSVAAPQFLTGVVFNDLNGNRRYDLGEGLVGVTISNGSTSVQTNGAGGWSMFVNPGTYTVTATGGALTNSPSARVTVPSGVNVEVDFISGFAIGEVNFSRQNGANVLTVDCAVASLQDAINAAAAGYTINVTGTCSENILVRNEKQRIAIIGSGATINANNASAAVNVRGKGITLQNFTITGGSNGVEVNRGSNAVITGNTIQNSAGHGVLVSQLAFAAVTGNVIQNHSAGAGVMITEASTARIGFSSDSDSGAAGNTIQSNLVGVQIDNRSSARIIGNSISANSGDGVIVLRDSQADIASNTISGNGGDAIEAGENAMIQLGEDSGSSIFESPNGGSGNAGFGIKCTTGAVADGRTGSLTGNTGATSFADGTCVNDLS